MDFVVGVACHLLEYVLPFFIAVKNMAKDKKVESTALVHKIASASLGIYFIHMFLVQGFPLIFNIEITSIKWILLGPIIIYLVSLLMVICMKKIPLI